MVRSPHVHTLWFPPGLPASDSPVVTSHQTLPLDYGTADVNHRRQPECSYCQGLGQLIDLLWPSPFLGLWCSPSPPGRPLLPDLGLLALETGEVSDTVTGRLKCTSSSSSMASKASACSCNLAASRCDFRLIFFAADLTITTWQSSLVLKNT